MQLFWKILALVGILGIIGGSYSYYNLSKEYTGYRKSAENRISYRDSESHKARNTLEEERKSAENYKNILIQGGTLRYISLEALSGSSEVHELFADPTDTIRLYNPNQTGTTIRFYEDHYHKDDTPVSVLDIPADEIALYPLTSGGILYYVTDTSSGFIIAGKEASEDYFLESFLSKEVFSLLQKEHPESIDRALVRFNEITEKDPKISKNCHNLAHEIGHKAFEFYGFQEAISHTQEDMCAGGYTHGILEEYFATEPKLAQDPESACGTIEEKKKGSCFHGVGHGLMFTFGNDVEKALEGCRKLSSSVWKNRCAEGVFMELYSGNTKHALGKVGYNTGALFGPCTQYASGSEGYACGLYAGLGYLRYANEDYIGGLGACETGGLYTNICIRGIGREVGKRYMGDVKKLETLCKNLSSPDKYLSCINGGINYTAFRYEEDKKYLHQYCLKFDSPRGEFESILKNKAEDTEEDGLSGIQ